MSARTALIARLLVAAVMVVLCDMCCMFWAHAVGHMTRACTDQLRRNRCPDAYHPDQIGFVDQITSFYKETSCVRCPSLDLVAVSIFDPIRLARRAPQFIVWLRACDCRSYARFSCGPRTDEITECVNFYLRYCVQLYRNVAYPCNTSGAVASSMLNIDRIW